MKKIVLLLNFLAFMFLVQSCVQSESEGVQNVDQVEFSKIAKSKDAIILDVRTREEIVSEGYIKGANMFLDYNSPNFEKELEKLDKSKKYLVYCKSGGRSSGATALMDSKGFKSVYNLEGGFSSWTGSVAK